MGWSLYPVAYLPGQSTFEMQVTSGKFDADMFVMTNATEFETKNNYQVPYTETVSIDASGVGTLSKVPVTSTVSVRGFVQAVSAAAGKFSVSVSGDEATITFLSTDVASVNIPVSYYYEATADVAEIDNQSSAVGEAVLIYPVYSADTDCAAGSSSFGAGSIIGHVILKVYKARITQQPGLDGSYKTASTYQFTLAALDAKRNDGNTYSIAYIKD